MKADVIVIGAGAVGAATLYQLARRGVRALAIDRFAPPHDQGSSHGETRVTRIATGEGAHVVPFAMRSHAIWRELESETGQSLLRLCGFLAIDGSGGEALRHGRPGFVDSTVAIARRFGIIHEVLSAGELARRIPVFRLAGDERVYFELGAGAVYPERAIAAQIERAIALGAKVQAHETVTAIRPGPAGVDVQTDKARYSAARVVIAAGAWAPSLARSLAARPAAPLRLLRQVLHWFPAQSDAFSPDRFPTFLWLHGPRTEDNMYGFPMLPGCTPAVKLASEQFAAASSAPEAIDRTVATAESETMYARHVAGRLAGLGGLPVRAAACIYTHAPDGGFIIDHAPDSDRVLIASACSGHGFKHSAGVGEHIAEVVAGRAALNPAFSAQRAALHSGSAQSAAHG